jgi:hypothetical protein
MHKSLESIPASSNTVQSEGAADGEVLNIVHSVADPDPGSGILCLFDPWIWYPGSGIRNRIFLDPGSWFQDPKLIY